MQTGMRFGFSEDDDPHLRRVVAYLKTRIDADDVVVDGELAFATRAGTETTTTGLAGAPSAGRTELRDINSRI